MTHSLETTSQLGTVSRRDADGTSYLYMIHTSGNLSWTSSKSEALVITLEEYDRLVFPAPAGDYGNWNVKFRSQEPQEPQEPATRTAFDHSLEIDLGPFLTREIQICRAIADQKAETIPGRWQPPYLLTAIHQLEATLDHLRNLRAMAACGAVTRASHGPLVRDITLALAVTTARLAAFHSQIEEA